MKSYPKGLKYISGRALGRLDLSFLFYNTFLPFKKYKFFSEGFGDLGKVKDLKSLLVSYAENTGRNESDYPLHPFWKEREVSKGKSFVLNKAYYISPLSHFLPEESQLGCFQLILPKDIKRLKGIVIHTASTGDSTFKIRRQLLAEPLLEHGIGSLIKMIPFYGERKPEGQKWHFSLSVSDFLVGLGVTVLEVSKLISWVREMFPNVGVGTTGISLGGGTSSFGAAITEGDLAMSPCLSGPSPSPLVSGALHRQIDWSKLESESGLKNREVKVELYKIMEKYHVKSLVNAFPLEKVGRRSLVQINARDDYVVEKKSGEKLFQELSATCLPGHSFLKEIGGGHLSSFVASQHFFVPAIVESFKLIEKGAMDC